MSKKKKSNNSVIRNLRINGYKGDLLLTKKEAMLVFKANEKEFQEILDSNKLKPVLMGKKSIRFLESEVTGLFDYWHYLRDHVVPALATNESITPEEKEDVCRECKFLQFGCLSSGRDK